MRFAPAKVVLLGTFESATRCLGGSHSHILLTLKWENPYLAFLLLLDQHSGSSSRDLASASERNSCCQVLMDCVVLSTKSGFVRGVRQHSSDGNAFISFCGIPYAEAPVGDLRFRPPRPKAPWHDTLEALKCGPDCPQFNPITR